MTIRQFDLERLRRLIRQKDRAHDEYQALRADLIERYWSGSSESARPSGSRGS